MGRTPNLFVGDHWVISFLTYILTITFPKIHARGTYIIINQVRFRKRGNLTNNFLCVTLLFPGKSWAPSAAFSPLHLTLPLMGHLWKDGICFELVLKKGFDVPNFDQVVQPRRDEHLAFWVKTEVCDAMLEVVKACLGLSLSLCVDLDVTLLADSDGDLVAFKGQGQAPRGAPVANSASTFSEILRNFIIDIDWIFSRNVLLS